MVNTERRAFLISVFGAVLCLVRFPLLGRPDKGMTVPEPIPLHPNEPSGYTSGLTLGDYWLHEDFIW